MRIRITRQWRPAGFPGFQLRPGTIFEVKAALAKYLLAMNVAEPAPDGERTRQSPNTFPAENTWSLVWRLTKDDSVAVAVTSATSSVETLQVQIDQAVVFSCAFPRGERQREIGALAETARRELECRGWSDTVRSTWRSLADRFRELHETALWQLKHGNYHALHSLLQMERRLIDDLDKVQRAGRLGLQF